MFHARKRLNTKGLADRVSSAVAGSVRAKRTNSEPCDPSLKRHPNDGWVLGELWPMPKVTRRALRALIRLICPTEGPHSPELEKRIEVFIRRQMLYMHPILGAGLWMTPLLLDWSPLWMGKNLRPLSRLDRARAMKILDELATTSFVPAVALLIGMRATILAAYCDMDEVHEAMDYDPVPFIRSRIAVRERTTNGGEIRDDDMISK